MSLRSLSIYPTPPFNFEFTAENQPYFRKGDNQRLDKYERLLDLGDTLVLATVTSDENLAGPGLTVDFQGAQLTESEVKRALTQLKLLLGASQDLEPFYRFVEGDPVMENLVRTFHGMHQTLSLSVFETLAQAILGQQLSASVARVIRGLLIEAYGPSLTINGETYRAFPRAESIAGAIVEDLRRLKLSQRKAEYLHGLALAELNTPGGLNYVGDLKDEEVVKEMTALRGVGMWSAQWVLSRALGRPDSFPVGDLALRRIVSQLYFGGGPLTDPQLAEFSMRWSPFRSLATSYLFAAVRTGRGQDITVVF